MGRILFIFTILLFKDRLVLTPHPTLYLKNMIGRDSSAGKVPRGFTDTVCVVINGRVRLNNMMYFSMWDRQ